MEPDTFSVRWTGQVQPRYSEVYVFYTESDDGVRLWVNNQLIIDNWTDHPPQEDSGTIELVAGKKYDIKMEMYENGGGAVARLLWESPSQPKEVIPKDCLFPPPPETGNGLRGEYFDDMEFGELAMVRRDLTVDFDWGEGSPTDGMTFESELPGAAAAPAASMSGTIEPDTFSVRWTGQVQPRYSEVYVFYTESDDGVRLWVNGQLLIDNWTDHAVVEDSGTIELVAGKKYDIKMEMYENGGFAVARLLWESPSQPKEVIPKECLFPPPPETGNGLRGEYFDDMEFGELKVIRRDATIDFDWGEGSPTD